ncbi:MAG: DUF1254 domain-containing protein [Actinomycetota bacterium]|nr:DUF1254 domain-containing protein [Actinomycetota bacterium]
MPGTGLVRSPDAAHELGVEAYLYLYPLVLMELTRRQLTNVERPDRGGRSPMGAFGHARAYPSAEARAVVRPNFDTLYSVAWFDVAVEPVLVRLPPTPGRYAIVPFMDMWTDVFAAPGTRSTGEDGGLFAVVDPAWQGTLPEGAVPLVAPTPTVWVIGRIQTNGPDDYPAVHALQRDLVAGPLSEWPTPRPPVGAVDPAVDTTTPPLRQVNRLSAEELFALGAHLLVRQPPHATDWTILRRLARLGIVAGQPFLAEALEPAVRAALGAVPSDARVAMAERGAAPDIEVDGWRLNRGPMGVYGNDYARRALIAMVGLGALPPEDAVYAGLVHDALGQPLDGAHQYRLHFAPDRLPPADAFWSVTMYDAEGFQVANPRNRFALGDRDPLVRGPDGSLDIVIGPEPPVDAPDANWLPSPASGPLGVTLRLYAPRPSVAAGVWTPPPVVRQR